MKAFLGKKIETIWALAFFSAFLTGCNGLRTGNSKDHKIDDTITTVSEGQNLGEKNLVEAAEPEKDGNQAGEKEAQGAAKRHKDLLKALTNFFSSGGAAVANGQPGSMPPISSYPCPHGSGGAAAAGGQPGSMLPISSYPGSPAGTKAPGRADSANLWDGFSNFDFADVSPALQRSTSMPSISNPVSPTGTKSSDWADSRDPFWGQDSFFSGDNFSPDFQRSTSMPPPTGSNGSASGCERRMPTRILVGGNITRTAAAAPQVSQKSGNGAAACQGQKDYFLKGRTLFVKPLGPEEVRDKQDGSSWKKAFSTIERMLEELDDKEEKEEKAVKYVAIAKGKYSLNKVFLLKGKKNIKFTGSCAGEEETVSDCLGKGITTVLLPSASSINAYINDNKKSLVEIDDSENIEFMRIGIKNRKENPNEEIKKLMTIDESKNISLYHVVFADSTGTAITVNNSTVRSNFLHVYEMVSRENKVFSAGAGAVIKGNRTDYTDEKSTWRKNTAVNGAAVLVDSGAMAVFQGSVFERNDSSPSEKIKIKGFGGAVLVNGDDDEKKTSVSFLNTKFTENQSSNKGGAVSVIGNAHVEFKGECEFKDNTAAIKPEAHLARQKTMKRNHSQKVRSRFGIKCSGTSGKMNKGGAIYASNSFKDEKGKTKPHITIGGNVNFTENASHLGGAIASFNADISGYLLLAKFKLNSTSDKGSKSIHLGAGSTLNASSFAGAKHGIKSKVLQREKGKRNEGYIDGIKYRHRRDIGIEITNSNRESKIKSHTPYTPYSDWFHKQAGYRPRSAF